MDDHNHPEQEMLRVMRPMYARHWLLGPAPRHDVPDNGMPPSTAYHLIHDELIMDGSSRFNLATFCGTWMEPEAPKLMAETFDKNMIDKDEYPQTAELEMRCVHMLAKLWHSPDPGEHSGHLHHRLQRGVHAGRTGPEMALARKDAQAGKPADRPNLVLGTNTQVCWHKFARYWDIEERSVPLEGNAVCDRSGTGRARRAMRTPSAWSRCWAAPSLANTRMSRG